MDDRQLLREYVENGSESAFETLVKRHVDMVHASALRQLGDAHLAQDVTQAVFLLLVRKASRLPSSVILSGWLYRTTQNVAGHALRGRIRQQRREQEAAQMITAESVEELWGKLAPHLDGAIGSLNAADRNAVVLRFLQQRSFRDVAGTLGVSEDAAKKRVQRALEKLRAHLTARGIATSAVALGAVLGAQSAEGAPGTVVSAAVAAGADKAAATVNALTLAGSVAREWFLAKLKWAGVLTAATALVLSIAGWQFRRADSAATHGDSASAATGGVTAPLAAAVSAADPTATVPPATSRTMRLLVVSANDNSPLTNAAARIDIRGPNGSVLNLAADANGAIEFALPGGKFAGMSHWLSAPGHVPRCYTWDSREESFLPAEYVVKLDPGIRAAGRVVNEDGQPVAGAKLRFNGNGMKMNARDYVDYRFPGVAPVSDAHGEWVVDFLEVRQAIYGFVRHADYAETMFSFTTEESGALTNTITLKRGASVSGVAQNADGSTVSGAAVTVDWPQTYRQDIRATTDAAGRFQFPHVTPGPLQLRASVDGLPAYEKFMDLPPEGLTLTLTLAENKIAGHAHLRGRVLDEAGEPVAGVHVGLRNGQPALEGVKWSAETDRAGRFEWTQAPEGSVHLTLSSWDYEPVDDVPLTAGDEEHILTMKPIQSLTTRCRVTDKSNSQPISRFRVMDGKRDTGWRDGIDSMRFVGEGNNGFFEFRRRPEPLSPHWFPIVRVEADGFEPATIVLSNSAASDVDLVFELETARTFEGVVLTAAGLPAAGAEVALDGKHLTASLQEPGRFQPLGADLRDYRTATAADGSFQMASRPGAVRLLIAHRDGWAVVPVRNVVSGTIYLQPWGRVEGVLRIGNQPGARQRVVVRDDNDPGASMPFHFATTTDEQGRFVFDQVPPGRIDVSRFQMTPFSRDGTGYAAFTQRKWIDVKPGDTTSVTIGGSGVKITGRLQLDAARENVAFDLGPQNLRPAAILPELGKVSPGYGFFCRIDGSFVVDDVPPGEYEFEARVYTVKDRNAPDAAFTGLGIAERKVKVVVPENQSELNLGDVIVSFPKR